ncbi:MAG: prefoldin subunit beta [Thaumarchaeota archaeon]|nr:prefoldin subunit beta [Candidatus Terraquivivens yellowstonensis]MCL7387581.1 prefoldin subunit beta [Candidatus Terraquivivens yellowstonensis]MCL7392974.1 prefoldin subunit beta [Candidatus Terraquivivens yellowstonensis]MCL7395405.1 prefoldin subunit beta [Candidatus Terraquivivens yellowstonensis]MCL7398011.1 prefoldin subunit beta [Candidatus Terraquivivens yellowstonensis]
MSKEIPPSVQQQLLRLQQLQQTLSALLAEKQRLEAELAEINNALEELEKVDENAVIYKAVGPILVRVNKDRLTVELKDKKELTETRLKVLEKQDAKMRTQIESVQKDIQRIMSGQQTSS